LVTSTINELTEFSPESLATKHLS